MKKIINEPLNEKLKFLSGVDCWHTYSNDNIEALRMSDGPHGLRYVYKEENYEQISKAIHFVEEILNILAKIVY